MLPQDLQQVLALRRAGARPFELEVIIVLLHGVALSEIGRLAAAQNRADFVPVGCARQAATEGDLAIIVGPRP
jgi:hypothetical protein